MEAGAVPEIILVVGMHRSGTSMVARGLAEMGFNLGRDVDVQPHPANPHGHWEHAQVWRAQEALLVALGREWHSSPGRLPDRWLEWPESRAVADQFARLAREEIRGRGHWLVKDPRTSLLLPLWRSVASRLAARLRIVWVFRAAKDVARSLYSRNGMAHASALRIFNLHQRSIARDSAGLSLRQFQYEAIMLAPAAEFAAMGVFCGLTEGVATARAQKAAALVDPGLWHHRAAASGIEDSPVDCAADFMTSADLPSDGVVLIVMRTRWRLGLLARAVRSVLAQTYPHWVLRLVNDGGPARLVEVEIEPYKELLQGRYAVLHLPRQQGMEAATNAGVASAMSDFIAIHDDDDTWAPEFLEKMVRRLARTGEIAAVSHSLLIREVRDGNQYVRASTEPFGPDLAEVTAADLADRNRFPPIALVFRRAAYDTAGPFDENMPAVGDWLFNRRLAALSPIGVHPEPLARWHQRDPGDPLANSLMTDHLRFAAHVRSWPACSTPPGYFGQARQVTLWDDVAAESGCARLDPPGVDGRALSAGLYLVRLPLADDMIGRVLSWRTEGQPVPGLLATLTPAPGGLVTVLLNAPRPVTFIGVGAPNATAEPLAQSAYVLRLGNCIDSLETFAGPPRLPDMLCIGAQRSGTTWLYEALRTHPAIWTGDIKERHHFDWDGVEPEVGAFRQAEAMALLRHCDHHWGSGDRDTAVRRLLRHAFPASHSWASYAAAFDSVPAERIACDFTPAYATLEAEKVEEIARLIPGLKIIFVLRDPVSRALSGALHALSRAGISEPAEEQILQACETPANVLRTDYLRALDNWGRVIPAERMLVLFHEDIASDPAGLLAKVCSFLGVAPCASDGAWPAVNEAARNAGRYSVPWPVLARIKALLSARWLPMLTALELRLGGPAAQWRLAAEARIRAAEGASLGYGAGRDHTVLSNLVQWDWAEHWEGEGDQWIGQSRECQMGYDDWKAALLDRYLVQFPAGGVIVEIGPGHGRWSERLLDHADLLVCCDVSPNCLDACRQRLRGRGRLRTHLCQGSDLPEDLGGRVDGVWSYDCFVHMHPQECEAYLAEVARVLKPGAHAVIHHADRTTSGVLGRAMDWVQRKAPQGDHGWRSRVSRRDMAQWARRAGLVVVRQEQGWLVSRGGVARWAGVPRFGDCISVFRQPADAGRWGGRK